jgi:hypothetical protein
MTFKLWQTDTARKIQPKHLKTVAQLEEALGEDFILWCGSAISSGEGKPTSPFPMTGEFLAALFQNISICLQNSDILVHKVAATYAHDLSLGRLKPILSGLKFEDCLGRVKLAIGDEGLRQIMASTYRCRDNCANANHRAIAYLLQSGAVKTCITTNFDDGIESCAPLETFAHNPHCDNVVPASARVLKLHGDVRSGRYVTTAADLIKAQEDHQHGYLAPLLNGKTLFVCGYSGNGDVDLYPYLVAAASSGAKLIWADRDTNETQAIASSLVVTDLFKGPSDNRLQELAMLKGWQPPTAPAARSDWVKGLADAVQNLDRTDLFEVVFQTLFGTAASEYLHLCQLCSKTGMDAQVPFTGGRPYLEWPAYNTAITQFQSETDSRSKLHWIGYSLWRLHRYEEALTELRSALVYPETTSLSRESNEISVARNYLEVLRDLLMRSRPKNRQYLWQKYDGDLYLHDLTASDNQKFDALDHGFSDERRLLNKIIILELDLLLNKDVSFNECVAFAQRAKDLRQPHAEFAALQLLLRLNLTGYFKGLRPMRELRKFYWGQRNWIWILKCYAAIIHATTPLPLRPLACRINSKFFGRVRSNLAERNLERAKQKWAELESSLLST